MPRPGTLVTLISTGILMLACIEAQAVRCREVITDESPFFVSDATKQGSKHGEMNWEKNRYINDPRGTSGYIPRRSLVKLHPQADRHQAKSKEGQFIPILVVALPSDVAEVKAKASRREVRTLAYGSSRRVKPGDEGFITATSLHPVDNYTFIVTEDSPLLKIPEGGRELLGRQLKLARDEACLAKNETNKNSWVKEDTGCYKLNRCCHEEDGGVETCEDSYIFRVLARTPEEKESEILIGKDKCENDIQGLRAVHDSQIPAFQRIVDIALNETKTPLKDIEFLDGRGFVKIPVDPETGDGPFGSTNYNPEPEKKGHKIRDDAYMEITAACAFTQVLEAHSKSCTGPGCRVQWGDAFHPDEWKDHVGHDKGTCIDIRPLRTTDEDGRLNINQTPAQYDRRKTEELIRTMVRAGADYVIFNDKEIYKNMGKPEYMNRVQSDRKKDLSKKAMKAHSDHLHVCFDPASKQVQDTCASGVPSP